MRNLRHRPTEPSMPPLRRARSHSHPKPPTGFSPRAKRPHSRLTYFKAKTRLVCPLWPRKVRVGANSPSLWPTIFSVIYTGINRFPLWTAIVWPTNSGKITERRDHVRMIRFSVPRFMVTTRSSNLPSMNGPFFSERATLFPLDRTRPVTSGASECTYQMGACRVSWRLLWANPMG
jgi:hypothetical protein